MKVIVSQHFCPVFMAIFAATLLNWVLASSDPIVYKIPYRRARAWPSRVRARAKVKGILHTTDPIPPDIENNSGVKTPLPVSLSGHCKPFSLGGVHTRAGSEIL